MSFASRLLRRLRPVKKVGQGPRALRLLQQIREAGIELPADARIIRAYVGHNQRACGAWSWYVHSHEDPSFSLGSQWPVSALVKGFTVSRSEVRGLNDIHLDPKENKK